VPVVGYEYGGVGDLLKELFPEGRVPPADLGSLVSRCEALLRQPQPVSEEQPYTLQRMLDDTLTLYQQLTTP
jgi:hypothetical protein